MIREVIFTFTLLASFLNAATLLNYDIIDNSTDVELRLSFDSKFDGEILQENSESGTNFILKNTTVDGKFTNQLSSPIINDIVIESKNSDTHISIKGSKSLVAKAALSDELTLNIKFSDKNINTIKPSSDQATTKEKTNKGFPILKTTLILLTIATILATIFVVIRVVKKERAKMSFNIFDEKDTPELEIPTQNINEHHDLLNTNINDEIYDKNEDFIRIKKDSVEIIYNEKISDDKELILVKHNGKVYLSFLSHDNEIPADIYEGMREDQDKFDEFLNICKSQSR